MSTSPAKASLLESEKPNYWLVWELFCNVILAIYFLQFVMINSAGLLQAFRLSTMLLLIKVSADTAFHLIRSPAKQISHNVFDWMIGIAGAYVNFFYHSVQGQDMWIGTTIQILGFGLSVFAMLSLNRSIGFVAANRGIKTEGLYRFVRHPLYFAYIVAFFGYLLNHFTIHNIVVYLLMVSCLFLRTCCEERVLEQDPEYKEYKGRVKYRIIPYVI